MNTHCLDAIKIAPDCSTYEPIGLYVIVYTHITTYVTGLEEGNLDWSGKISVARGYFEEN